MIVLGIESSCDETAAAVVADGRRELSSVVASQADLHAQWGGVVPEVASRQHVHWIVPTIERALADAGMSLDDLDGVAVTRGPGLAGSLIVGMSAAKALAWARDLPLVGVNHLEGHVYANWLLEQEPEFPLVCLIVSGGHTDLLVMPDHLTYKRLGRTRDDAAGEAFDKVARLLGLGYPGGPAVERAAQAGDPRRAPLPRAWLPDTDDFSFSGLKTAVLRLTESPVPPAAPDVAAGFQESVVDVLAEKTVRAARQHGARTILLAGGVAANSALRDRLTALAPVPLLYPPLRLCTDNASMIAAAGCVRLAAGYRDGLDLDVSPSLKLI
jgi:N6-L-threonylcarbamoyladenine synthase